MARSIPKELIHTPPPPSRAFFTSPFPPWGICRRSAQGGYGSTPLCANICPIIVPNQEGEMTEGRMCTVPERIADLAV